MKSTGRRADRSAPATCVAGALFVLASSAAAAQPAASSVADRVVESLQLARREAGRESLERRPALDRAARAKAERLAALPPRRRLADPRPIEDDVRAAGAARFAAARSRVELRAGATRLGAAFSASWADGGRAWLEALDPRRDAVGAAHVRAADGWDVFVAVLVDDPAPAPAPRALRRRALETVNAERVQRGMAALREDPRLSRVARRHSRAMAVEGFFDHVSPQGSSSAERVRRAGIDFRVVGENIHRNRGYADPVRQAVRGWLDSPPHRRAMLDPAFTVTGMGVWVADDGEVFFTQLFLRPRRRGG